MTVAPETKFVPLTVMDVPPIPLPVEGETVEMVGEGAGVVRVPDMLVADPVPTPFVAVTLME